MYDNFESILETIKPLGWWQINVSLWITYLGLVVGVYLFGYNFLAAKLDHWCNVPELNDPLLFPNWTTVQKRSFSTQGKCEYFQRDYRLYYGKTYQEAMMLSNDTATAGTVQVRSCREDYDQWHYASDHYGLTVQNEWNIVCDRAHWLPATQTVIMLGAMAGVWICGHMADHYGRRTVILWVTLPNILVALATAFSPSLVWFAALRFLQGGLGLGLYSVAFVLNMEVLVPRHRDFVAFWVQITWGTVMFFPVALFGYYIRHWRYLQFDYALFGTPMLLMYVLIPESPRWLILHGRVEEAERVVRRAARWNGTSKNLAAHQGDDDGLDLRAIRRAHVTERDLAQTQKKANFLQLFRTSGIRNRTLALIVGWVTVNFTTYGITFYSKGISTVPYIALTCLGISKMLAHVVGAYVFRWYGRRIPLASMFWTCALACLLIFLGIHLQSEWLTIAMAVLGAGAASAAFDGGYIYTAEVYPTSIRSVGFTTCGMLGRIGSAAAPYVADLDSTNLRWLPTVIFAAAAVCGGIAMLCLPEMHDATLPETINDIEHIKLDDDHNKNGEEQNQLRNSNNKKMTTTTTTTPAKN